MGGEFAEKARKRPVCGGRQRVRQPAAPISAMTLTAMEHFFAITVNNSQNEPCVLLVEAGE